MLATQNPIESEGVYPLPEAQRDRFLLKILVPYPTPTEELEIVSRMGVDPPRPDRGAQHRASSLALQNGRRRGVRAPAHRRVRRAARARDPRPRAVRGLTDLAAASRTTAPAPREPRARRRGPALALLRGRDYVLPQDVTDVAPDVLRHRLVLSFDAVADGVTVETVVQRLIVAIAPPDITPAQSRFPSAPFSSAPMSSPASEGG